MSPLQRRCLAAVVIATAAGVLGCAPTNAPAPPQAAQDAAVAKAAPLAHLSRTERLRAFLTERYGKAATLSGKWRGSWAQDGDTLLTHWHVCAEQPVVTGDSWQQLLAVCGSPLDGAHPDPGAIDFFVLRPEADRFAVAAALTGQNFGSRGEPGTVQILRAGSDFYGFRIEHGWFGQGYSLITQTLVLPGPNGLVDAGGVRSHIDNTAAYDCDDADAEPDCQARLFNLDFTLRFDDRDPAARQWPLLIEETGLGCGGQPVRREHRFTLDPNTWTYAFPEALQREGCE